jgi:NADPH-dependent 2,4-dienoyl-CoA reductase/sulfur reductase-like enzyme
MNIVIIGGGLAGASAAEELRKQGHTGSITLICAEPHRPYERPPLSKGLMLGDAGPDSVYVHAAGWYAEHHVDLITGARVTEIDLEAAQVVLADRTIPFDRLLLATGSKPRHLAMAEQSGADVRYLRTLEDSLALKARLSDHVLIVGAGWIGLEIASAIRKAGGKVTVVESAALPLAAVLGPELAPVFVDLHRSHEVDLRLEATLESLTHEAGKTTARLGDGSSINPDLVLVGIGAEADDALAAAAGLAVDHGVLVDAGLRTSDPRVFAAGDVANHDHPIHGRMRVEHWDAAIHQGHHAARAMLGADEPYTREPYFFTDQYDLGMEYVGHVGPKGYDEVVIRGDLDERVFTALWIKDGTVVAGMHCNDWDAIDPIRSVVGGEATAALRDAAVPLADAVPGGQPDPRT